MSTSDEQVGEAGDLTPGNTIADLEQRRSRALAMGGPERIQRHHESGRLTARERLERLIDAGSWSELGLLAEPELRRAELVAADAVVTGFGRIGGRRVAVVAVDATVLAGTTSPITMQKQDRIAAWAGRRGIPLIFLADNDGGRLPDVLGWRFSRVAFDFSTFLQTPVGCPEIPRMCAVLGASFGDSSLHSAMSHFVVLKRDAAIALSGPPVVKGAIGEDVSAQELGGPEVASEVNGSAHLVVEDERQAIHELRRFLSYMPDSAALPAPVAPPADPARDPQELVHLVPEDGRRGYDMRKVLEAIVDGDSLLHWGERFGPSLLCALARIDGNAVGVIASQPQQRAGVMDVPALTKEARFVEVCETFNLPMIFLQDVPGLMIGVHAEKAGVLRAYEQVVTRLARATVPKIAVIVRKAYGGGHIALGGRPVKPDLLLAWPTAEIGFMAPETGVQTVHRRRLAEMLEQNGREAHDELAADLEAAWAAESEPWEAARHVVLDDVIDPRQTREAIMAGVEFGWGSGPRVTQTGWRS
ncbi:MAG TPA: carboxyl transferase domain-containing protein [Solirubrobacteraceae bacterium]